LKRFLARQNAHANLAAGCDFAVDRGFNPLGKIRAHALQLEIHARFQRLHIAAGHMRAEIAPDHAAQNMQRRVRAHEGITTFPVQNAFDFIAPFKAGLARDDANRLAFFSTFRNARFWFCQRMIPASAGWPPPPG
jgi:hypothetical protein